MAIRHDKNSHPALHNVMLDELALRKKSPYLELFLSVFSHIWTEYGKMRRKMRTRITPNTGTFHEVQMSLQTFLVILCVRTKYTWLKEKNYKNSVS